VRLASICRTASARTPRLACEPRTTALEDDVAIDNVGASAGRTGGWRLRRAPPTADGRRLGRGHDHLAPWRIASMSAGTSRTPVATGQMTSEIDLHARRADVDGPISIRKRGRHRDRVEQLAGHRGHAADEPSAPIRAMPMTLPGSRGRVDDQPAKFRGPAIWPPSERRSGDRPHEPANRPGSEV